jgi:hypothetical protein
MLLYFTIMYSLLPAQAVFLLPSLLLGGLLLRARAR